MEYIIGIIIAVIALIVVISNIVVVQQSRAYVIERLGAFQEVWGVGLHIKIPFIDRIARRVSLKEQVLDYVTTPVLRYRFENILHFDGRVTYASYVTKPEFRVLTERSI